MHQMWKRLQPWNFESLYSLFYTTKVHDPNVKAMVLQSMQRQALHQENNNHVLMNESWNPLS